MKKIYIIILTAILFLNVAVQAQQYSPLLPKKQFLYNKSTLAKNPTSKASTISNSGWFNYGEAAEMFYNTMPEINASYLFPDSLGYGEFGAGNFEPCWVHHIAELVDFQSPLFVLDPSTSWVANNGITNYNIDSISFVYGYTRNNINLSIVDTLIITLFDNTHIPNTILSPPLTGAIANNFSTDTLAFQMLGYNSLGNFICAPSATTSPQASPVGAYVLKVLLTQADTASLFFAEKKIGLPTPFATSIGKFAVVDMMFKPGYNYYPGEHISQTQNAFYFASRKENGGVNPTYMNHMDCNYGSSQCDNSMSYIIPTATRYNTAGSMNYRYSPTVAFAPTYFLEHHLISFHLTDTIASPCQVNSQFSVFADSLNPGNYFAYNNSTGSGTLSYLWDFGDGTTSTQPYPFHQYAIPGQYVVCLNVTANSGTTTCTSSYCDSSSVQKMATGFVMSQFNVLSPTVTQIQESENIKDIMIYPNPVDEQLNITLVSKEEHLQYNLVDALGRTIVKGECKDSNTIVNTSNLAKGFYSISVTNEKGKIFKTIKLVK